MQKTFFAFALCLLCLFATLWLSKEELSENGVKTYAGGLSSLTDFFSVEREDCNLSFFDSSPFRFKAESVFVKGECDLKNIAKKYDASIVKIIKNGDIIEYYMFSQRLRGRVIAGGETVNLHVAVSSYGYTIGTPFIFCGY